MHQPEDGSGAEEEGGVSGPRPTCSNCGHADVHHTFRSDIGCVLCPCPVVRVGILSADIAASDAAFVAMAQLAADRLDQIRKLQDSANKRLDEYRAVTGLLREVLDRLEAEAYKRTGKPSGKCGCPTCEIFKRAEVMNLR